VLLAHKTRLSKSPDKSSTSLYSLFNYLSFPLFFWSEATYLREIWLCKVQIVFNFRTEGTTILWHFWRCIPGFSVLRIDTFISHYHIVLKGRRPVSMYEGWLRNSFCESQTSNFNKIKKWCLLLWRAMVWRNWHRQSDSSTSDIHVWIDWRLLIHSLCHLLSFSIRLGDTICFFS